MFTVSTWDSGALYSSVTLLSLSLFFDFIFGSSCGPCWNCISLFESKRPTLYISFSVWFMLISSKTPDSNFFLAACFCRRISSNRICSSSSSFLNLSSSSRLILSASSLLRLLSSSFRAVSSSSRLRASSSLRILSSSLACASASSRLLRSSSFLTLSRSSRSALRRSSSWAFFRSSSSCLRRNPNWSWLSFFTSRDLTFSSYSSSSLGSW